MKDKDPFIDRVKSIKDLNAFYEFAQNISAENLRNQTVINEFQKIAFGTFITDLICYELNNINQSGLYNPIGANYTSINLINTKQYSVDLTVIDSKYISTDNKFIASFKQDYIILSLTEDGISYSLYQQKNDIDPSIMDKTKALTLVNDKNSLSYGQCILLKRHHDLFKYNKETSFKKIIFLSLTAKQPTSFIWIYNLDTLLPEQIVATIQDSRIENICILLSNFQYPESVTRMKEMLKHPKHNIRWTALKTLMKLDYAEGCNAVNNMIHDVHPEIRRAAIKTKELIEAQLTT